MVRKLLKLPSGIANVTGVGGRSQLLTINDITVVTIVTITASITVVTTVTITASITSDTMLGTTAGITLATTIDTTAKSCKEQNRTVITNLECLIMCTGT